MNLNSAPNFDISKLELVPKEKSNEQPKIISASEQETLDAKYAVPKSPERYVDEPKKATEQPVKTESPDSAISKIEAKPTQEEADMGKYIERKNEVKGEATALDKKADSFNKVSKLGFGVGGVSALTALGTWVSAGSVAGGAALLPVLAPIAAPIILGALAIGGVSLTIAGVSKFLKSRAQNKKYDLQNDNRAMFGNI